MSFEITVKDDALPSFIFKKFQNAFLDDDLTSWNFVKNISYSSKSNIHEWSFCNLIMADKQYNSYIAPQLEIALAMMARSVGVEIKDLSRIRAGLMPVSHKPIIHDPHVDSVNGKKTKYTALLYLNDSDGDTVFYNEIYDEKSNMSPEDYYKHMLKNKVTLKYKITPKENRFVCFDSSIFHSSSVPVKTQKRIVISFNFD